MVSWFEFVTGSDSILHGLDHFTVKLDQVSTLDANQVIMVAVFVVAFVPRPAVVKIHLGSEPAFGKQFECSIDGREPNRSVPLLHQLVEILTAEMPFRAEEHFKNEIALAASLQPRFFEMPLEDLFFGGPVLRRHAVPFALNSRVLPIGLRALNRAKSGIALPTKLAVTIAEDFVDRKTQ